MKVILWKKTDVFSTFYEKIQVWMFVGMKKDCTFAPETRGHLVRKQ